MTPKTRYEDRKRMKAERLYNREKAWKEREEKFSKQHDDEERLKEQFKDLVSSLDRIANVLELWADQQK